MNFSESFGTAADALIKKFSVGSVTISRRTGEYDTTTRKVEYDADGLSVVCDHHCRDEIVERFMGNRDFDKIKLVIIVSGMSISTYVPKNGDIITYEDDSSVEK
jgi:signal peptidase I